MKTFINGKQGNQLQPKYFSAVWKYMSKVNETLLCDLSVQFMFETKIIAEKILYRWLYLANQNIHLKKSSFRPYYLKGRHFL